MFVRLGLANSLMSIEVADCPLAVDITNGKMGFQYENLLFTQAIADSDLFSSHYGNKYVFLACLGEIAVV